MNCKPGDLAVVVKPSKVGNPPDIGEIVSVGHFNTYHDGWHLRPAYIDPRDGWEIVVPDEALRPICDPGDDARDETLSWLRVPSREGVHA